MIMDNDQGNNYVSGWTTQSWSIPLRLNNKFAIKV